MAKKRAAARRDIHGGFTSDLPEEIKSSGAGVQLGNVEITCLAFLDDYVTPTRNPRIIDGVLETLREYGNRWDVHWAIKKFRVLCYDIPAGDQGWTYEGSPVHATDHHKYLGVTHSTKKPYWVAHLTEKLGVALFILFGLLIGGRNAPGAALGVVRSMVWQVLDYGRATAPSATRGHAQIRSKLEAFQLKTLREILGLSNSAPILAVYGESGDLPDIWRERRKQLQIAFQMLSSPQTSLPRKVAREADTAVPKVGLFLRVSEILANHGGTQLRIEDFKSKTEIRRWIDRAAEEEWRGGIAQSSRLTSTYRSSTELRLRGYLKSDFRGRQTLTKFRADDLELEAASYRGRGGSYVDFCSTCQAKDCVETRAHFALQCEALTSVRNKHENIVRMIKNSRPGHATPGTPERRCGRHQKS